MAKMLMSLVLALGLSGCGYDGFYRYPCQDPKNWQSEECQPPMCEADGTCVTDVLPPDIEIESEATQCANQE